MAKRPLILVTNDDGILAPGLLAMAEAVFDLGDVLVCAPETERSGSSHSITLHSHLRLNPVRPGWWSVNGTPVDCVYLAALHLCPRTPDLVLSGVNPGYNLGTDVFYSGTVGGAAEGFIRGGAAMAVSAHRDQDPRVVAPVVRKLAAALLGEGRRHLWNVNVPRLSSPTPADMKDVADRIPIHVTRLGRRPYLDRVVEREDPQGRPYYWIGGPPSEVEDSDGEDTWSVTNGAVSVTPLELDLTARDRSSVEALLQRLTAFAEAGKAD